MRRLAYEQTTWILPEMRECSARLVLTNDPQARFNYARCPFVLITVLMGKKLKNQLDERGVHICSGFIPSKKKPRQQGQGWLMAV